MADAETRIVSGVIVLDKNGERLFLSTEFETRVRFGDRTIIGNQVLRVLGTDATFVVTDVTDRGERVSIAARLATPEELKQHDQLTDPTLVAEKIAKFEAIQARSFEIFQMEGGSAEDNWLRAERELLAA